jgi:hypothetical protein
MSYEKEQRFADAEPLFKRALAIREQAVGSDHPETAALVNNLASLYQEQGRIGDGLPLVERMIGPGRAQARAALPVLLDAGRQQLMPQEEALDDALDVVQHGAQSSAATAVNKLAVRLAAGSDHLAELVRRDQDLAGEAETLDKAIIAAVSRQGAKRNASAEQRSRDTGRDFRGARHLARNLGKRISGLCGAVEPAADDGKAGPGAIVG